MLSLKKCQFFCLCRFIEIRLEIMFSGFAQEKETFVTIKNRNFQSPKKSHFF